VAGIPEPAGGCAPLALGIPTASCARRCESLELRRPIGLLGPYGTPFLVQAFPMDLPRRQPRGGHFTRLGSTALFPE
jgi:hypothetical protein